MNCAFLKLLTIWNSNIWACLFLSLALKHLKIRKIPVIWLNLDGLNPIYCSLQIQTISGLILTEKHFIFG